MKLRSVQVECYSGGRADERPRRVIIGRREHVVARLLQATIEEGADSNERVERFKVMTVEGLTIELLRSGDGIWSLVSIRD